MKLSPRILLATLALAGSTSAFAWIDSGHMVIAAIASRRLTPKAFKECERLAKIGTTEKANTFISEACWADDTRDAITGPWHYINFHFRGDGKPVEHQPAEQNVVWAIKKYSAILGDKTKPDEERAEAMRYLIHFVGDVHQPLHAVARDSDEFPNGDRGGNDFPILLGDQFKGVANPPANLHALWDFGCGILKEEPRPLDPEGYGRMLILADKLAAEAPEKQAKNVNDLNPDDWAEESFGIAKNICYNLKPNTPLDEGYMHIGRLFSLQRITTAGYRLAKLLNQLVG